jgi:ApaG protein
MPKYQFRVEVQPAYQPEQSAPEQGVFTFSYTITISNVGEVAAQLISRHWVITDAAGGIQEVKGLGVVGHQPLLQPGQSFQYSSGCRLPTPSGTMQGSYFCVAEDGERFETEIAPFLLEDGSRRVLH